MPKNGHTATSVMHFTRSTTRTLPASSLLLRAAETVSSATKMPPTKRVCLGGRGREWAAESLKLLETMLELKDAKIFLEPMDPLKYPEYYTIISDPIDLSKIMLKFHGGSYPNLQQFCKDMRDMFDNYKSFFSDSNSDIYNQVRRLSAWFDSEAERIQSKWYRICMNSISASSLSSAPRVYQPRTGSLEARIQAIEADNQRIMGMCCTSSAPRPVLSVSQIRPRPPQTPIYAIRLATTSTTCSSTSLSVSSSSAQTSSGLLIVSKPALSTCSVPSVVTASGIYVGPRVVSTTGPILAAAKMVLIVDVTNVWFGAARCKPSQPVVISEQGIKLVFRDAESNVEFTIEAGEIVRCAAYFGNARKHTLFLFVVPNCTRRLPASLGDRQSLSTLVVIFLPALGQRQIADLVYIFWRISRLSLFGVSGGLLTEIDQKGALSLLSNIKPTILSTVAERMRDIAGTELPAMNVASNPITQHVAVPVTDAESIIDGQNHKTVSARRSKRKAAEDDDELDQRQHLRIKLTRRKHRHLSSEITDDTVDSIMCKTEVVDDDYESAVNRDMPSSSDKAADQYTIIEQWEPDGPNNEDDDDDDDDDDESQDAGITDAADADDHQQGEVDEAVSDNNVDNDLEIVLPSESEEAEIEVDNASFGNGVESQDEYHDDDLVMTGEKLNLRCPITQQIMKHPMKNKYCGHCYDRQGVEDLISHRASKARCPVPGCSNEVPLSLNDLKHEYNLWQFIQSKASPKS